MYYKKEYTNAKIMMMTIETWSEVISDEFGILVGMEILRYQSCPPNRSPTPKSKVPALAVTPPENDVSSFLKYVNVNLKRQDRNYIFYYIIYAQSQHFNMFLHPKEDISPAKGVLLYSMAKDSMMTILVALHSKFSQPDIVAAEYKDEHNLLDTTPNGYVFLQLLL